MLGMMYSVHSVSEHDFQKHKCGLQLATITAGIIGGGSAIPEDNLPNLSCAPIFAYLTDFLVSVWSPVPTCFRASRVSESVDSRSS